MTLYPAALLSPSRSTSVRRNLLATCAAIMLCFSATPSLAQSIADESLAIEIKLLHMKLSGEAPDYYRIIQSNPEFRSNPAMSQQAVIAQQRMLLEKIYGNAGSGTPVYARKSLTISDFQPNTRTLKLPAIAADDPIIFRVSEHDVYGIFIHNGDKITDIRPPFEFDDFVSLEQSFYSQRGVFSVQLALEPIAADKTPFVINNENVKVILTDISEIKITDNKDGKLLLHKKLNDDTGIPVPMIIPNGMDYRPLPPATP